MIAIIGHIDVDPADRDRVVASTVELQRSTQADEPGCLVYTIGADPADAGRIRITELWESAESLAAHFQHPNFVATGAAMRAVERRGGSAVKYHIDQVADVRGSDGVPTASFGD
jgi:quinol monooxygenase YgiN